MELSLIIYLSGVISLFLSAILFQKKAYEGWMVTSVIVGLFWTLIGLPYTIEVTQEKTYTATTPNITKTVKKVIVEWEDFEGYDRTTYFISHEDYVSIDSNVVWKSIIRKNSWGYHWSDDDDIEYSTKKNE